jgi:hypothetical protein
VAAYIWVVCGMWWIVSPWRFRDLMMWATATPERVRKLAVGRLVFALLIIVLGVTQF